MYYNKFTPELMCWSLNPSNPTHGLRFTDRKGVNFVLNVLLDMVLDNITNSMAWEIDSSVKKVV